MKKYLCLLVLLLLAVALWGDDLSFNNFSKGNLSLSSGEEQIIYATLKNDTGHELSNVKITVSNNISGLTANLMSPSQITFMPIEGQQEVELRIRADKQFRILEKWREVRVSASGSGFSGVYDIDVYLEPAKYFWIVTGFALAALVAIAFVLVFKHLMQDEEKEND